MTTHDDNNDNDDNNDIMTVSTVSTVTTVDVEPFLRGRELVCVGVLAVEWGRGGCRTRGLVPFPCGWRYPSECIAAPRPRTAVGLLVRHS